MAAAQLGVSETPIPGLLLVDLTVHGDRRGWFKENWQREKMTALGLPDFRPVQNNVSFNGEAGTTRGIHAEPWDKFVSVASGRIFGAWVDLREGESFGARFFTEIGPDQAVFVPRGVGNAYQTLEEATAYTYLVTAHWSPSAEYTFVNLADPEIGIPWPIPLSTAILSDKDLTHPELSAVVPFAAPQPLVLGAGGQLGTALRAEFPRATFLTRADLDICSAEAIDALELSGYSAVINAAAYTAVDAAESPSGRSEAWAANATGPARLAASCANAGVPLVHISSDYVFDGTSLVPYGEEAPLSPLSVYGQSKAAGDLAVAQAPKHYLIRTSWVIGEGKNFVDTMRGLAARGVSPTVIDDQLGRLTFASTIAAAIAHLLRTGASYGTYNCTNGGAVVSWADIATEVFRASGVDPSLVRRVSTAEYLADAPASAPRPAMSALDLGKLERTGFVPESWIEALQHWIL